MAYATLTHNGNKNIWDFETTVEEISSNGFNRRVRLIVSVRTKDFEYGRNGTCDVQCEEAQYSNKWNVAIPGSTQDRIVLIDKEFDVYVAPGTTTANINFEAVVSFYSSSTGSTPTATATISIISGFSLVSDITISSAKDIYFGDPCSITWTPMSSSFSYELEFSFGKYKEVSGRIYPKTTSPYTYTGLVIPETAASNTIYSLHEFVSVKLTQYSGSSVVGSPAAATFTITLKDNIIPSITSCTAYIDNSACQAIDNWGIAVAGYSKVRIVANAAGIYESKIDRYLIKGDYKATIYASTDKDTTLSYTGAAIGSSGNKSFAISCVDSRGRTSTEMKTSVVYFYPYTAPKATKLVIKKEERTINGITRAYMVATPTWNFDSIGGHNAAQGKLYYKLSTASDWTQHSGAVNNSGESFVMTDMGELSDESSYNFKVVVTDSLGNSSEKDTFSSTTKVLMDFQAGGMGLGIGKVCEIDNIGNDTQSMEVSMDAYFFREIYIKSNQQTLEDYIKSVSRRLVENVDYGDQRPEDLFDNPYPGQIYYMRVQEE